MKIWRHIRKLLFQLGEERDELDLPSPQLTACCLDLAVYFSVLFISKLLPRVFKYSSLTYPT